MLGGETAIYDSKGGKGYDSNGGKGGKGYDSKGEEEGGEGAPLFESFADLDRDIVVEVGKDEVGAVGVEVGVGSDDVVRGSN